MNVPTTSRIFAIADVETELVYRWRECPVATWQGQVIAELDELPNGTYLVLLDNRDMVVLDPEDRVELVTNRKETQ